MSVAENLPVSGAGEATILIDGARYDLPIKKGTIGPDVIARISHSPRRATVSATQHAGQRQVD